MGLFSTSAVKFPWTELYSIQQLEELLSSDNKVLIFKHSTRCNISSMMLNRFENQFEQNTKIITVFLDLIKHREISNLIADKMNVYHQSPQVILVEKNTVLYHASHNEIDALSLNKF